MNCHTVAPLLPSLGDGSLEPSEERELNEHLESCESCRASRGRLRKLEELLGAGLPVPEPGPDFYQDQRTHLLDTARQEAGGADLPASRFGRVIRAAAAAILLVGAGALLWRALATRVPGTGETSLRPKPSVHRPESPGSDLPGAPDSPLVSPATSPRAIVPAAPSLPRPESLPEAARTAVLPGAAARLSAMTEESVDIGLAETPRDRVMALYRAAEGRLKELGRVMRTDPGLAAELAGAYLLLLGEGVRSVLRDGAEPPQELALARSAAAERARGHEKALVEYEAAAQGKLKETLGEALAMSRELSGR